MYDTGVFGIQNPWTDEIGYACVMGNLGELLDCLSIWVQRACAVTKRFNRANLPVVPQGEIYQQQKCLMVTFEGREAQEIEDGKIIKKLGLKFRGPKNWPLFRGYRLGYVPRFLTADEAVYPTLALEQ